MEKILDPKFLPYLIFTICYAGFIALFLREKVLRKILELKIPTWVGKVVTSVSITLLILSLLDEVGLFLNEWYFYPKVFSMLRSIMGLPGVSYLVYFANFALLIPFFYQITEKNRQKLIFLSIYSQPLFSSHRSNSVHHMQISKICNGLCYH
jgi:hypothetical protein